jgi:tetratricopeptide (TPR) repeat protein
MRCDGGQDQRWRIVARSAAQTARPDERHNRGSRQDAEHHRLRAYFYQDTGDLDRAIEGYGEAIRIKPYAWYYSSRADLYRRKGDETRAIADYSEALRIHDADFAKGPNHANYYGRSEVYRELGRFDEALRDFDVLLKQQKEWNGYHIVQRGDLHLNKGDVERAIADYSEVIRREPDDENAHFRRALAYRAKGDNAAAIAARGLAPPQCGVQ